VKENVDQPAPSRPRALLKRAGTWLSRRGHLPCPRCAYDLHDAPLYREWRVCDNCGHHFPVDAAQRVKMLADPRSFAETESYLFTHPRGLEYARRVRVARRETHLRESVVTGTAEIQGHPVMLVILDFRFLGGTMGAAAGEKIARAFDHAAERRIPLVAVTSSGGARIQEGMVALMQMAKTAAAAQHFAVSRQPFITVLTNPTTGGVYASFANLADVILAEPRALVGFAGPRVVEILTGKKLPRDSHRAEFLLEHGMVDEIVSRPQLPPVIGKLLGNARSAGYLLPAETTLFGGEEELRALPAPTERIHFTVDPGKDGSASAGSAARFKAKESKRAWQSVLLARRPDRPTALAYVERIFVEWVELHGDHLYGDDPAIVAGIAKFDDRGVVVIGHERGRDAERERRRQGRAGPEGYRKAQRAMRLASKWGMPVVTFVDTPGADASYEAEKRGIAMALASSIAAMLEVRAPTVAVVIGEGGSGGALALAAADRVLMLERAVYSVISPEGASAILYGDDAHAAELAEDLNLTAPELVARGIVDEIIPEPPGGAHNDADAAAENVKRAIRRALGRLSAIPAEELVAARYDKYRHAGRGGGDGRTN
jgi:acetyl-CoA carboxylase carboxyl transferase subunit beta